MTEIAIRPLAASQIGTLTRLASDIWHTHYPGIISTEQIDFMLKHRYDPTVIANTLKSQNWDVAWMGNEMVGFANSFADSSEACWKLDKLYVHPLYQHRGIGGALLEAVKRHARQSSANRLILRVNKHNAIALAAYAKYGFKVYGEHLLEIGNGFVMDDYLLELNLCS